MVPTGIFLLSWACYVTGESAFSLLDAVPLDNNNTPQTPDWKAVLEDFSRLTDVVSKFDDALITVVRAVNATEENTPELIAAMTNASEAIFNLMMNSDSDPKAVT